MPIQYSRQIENVGTPNVPSIRANSLETGGVQAKDMSNLGQGLSNLGQGLTRAAAIMKNSQDVTDKSLAREKYTQATSELLEYVHQDLFRREGAEAVDVYSEFDKKLNDIRKSYLSQLKTENQRMYFSSSFGSLETGYKENVLKWQDVKRQEYKNQTLLAENGMYVDVAVANRTDPDMIKQSEQAITLNTVEANKTQDKSVIKQAVAKAIDNLHRSVLESYVYESPVLALEYLKNNFDKFDPKVRDKLKSEIKLKADAEIVRNKAIELAGSGLSLEEQLKEVDKIKDTKQAKDLRDQVKARYNERTAIKEAQNKQVIENEWDNLRSDPMNYKIPTYLPAKTEEAMEQYKAKKLKEYQAKNGTGVAENTDWETYYKISLMPESQFVKEDLTKYLSKLSASEFEKLVDLQKKARNSPQEAFRVRTVKEQVSSAIDGMSAFYTSGKPTEKTAEASRRKNLFYSETEKRIALLPTEEQTPENVKKIIDDLLTPIHYDTWRFGDEKTYFRFELPYLDDVIKSRMADTASVPANLEKYTKVRKEIVDGTVYFYVDGDGVRDVYDVTGAYVTSYKRKPYVKSYDPLTVKTTDTGDNK